MRRLTFLCTRVYFLPGKVRAAPLRAVPRLPRSEGADRRERLPNPSAPDPPGAPPAASPRR